MPSVQEATLVRTSSWTAPPRRRGGSQHHEALLLSSRGSGPSMTGVSADLNPADCVASAIQVLYLSAQLRARKVCTQMQAGVDADG